MIKENSRILSLLTAAAFTLCCLPQRAQAAEPLDFEVGCATAQAKAGETVKVPVTAKENPGYGSGVINVNWDSDALKLTNVEFSADRAPDNGSAEIVSDGSYCLSFGDDFATSDFTKTGTFFTLTFEVTENAGAGDYLIFLDQADVNDKDINPVAVTQTAGAVTLTGGAVNPAALIMEMGSTEVTLGEDTEVRVPVKAAQNPGYIVGFADLTWDPAVLTLAEIVYAEGTKNAGSAAIKNTGCYRIAFGDFIAMKDHTATGEMFTAVFTVNGGAAAGEYAIMLGNLQVTNFADSRVPVTVKAGSVTLAEQTITTTTTSATKATTTTTSTTKATTTTTSATKATTTTTSTTKAITTTTSATKATTTTTSTTKATTTTTSTTKATTTTTSATKATTTTTSVTKATTTTTSTTKATTTTTSTTKATTTTTSTTKATTTTTSATKATTTTTSATKATTTTTSVTKATTTTSATKATTTTTSATKATTTTTSTTKATTTTTSVTKATTTTSATTETITESTTIITTTSETVTSASETQTSETTTPSETTPTEPTYMLGDVNEDGEISVDDAQLTLNAYVKIMAGRDSGLTDQQAKAANVNKDNEVSVDDAQMILLYYVRNTLSGTTTTWDELLGKNKPSEPVPFLLKLKELFKDDSTEDET